MGPLGHVVVRLLLLQALQNDLVLPSDLHKLSLARLPVETLFELQGTGTGYHVHALRCLRVIHVHLR